MTIVTRPWGNWEVISEGAYDNTQYKVKFLTIDPDKAISLQFHDHRAEYWTIIRGNARITIGEGIINNAIPGDMISVPQGTIHKVHNIGVDPLVILELQMGTQTVEEDITRLQEGTLLELPNNGEE
jgi:mannose-6-phosphate isomerase-like protein (cupin superfamily)